MSELFIPGFPCIVCIVVFILHLLLERKDTPQNILTYLALIAGIYFFADAIYNVKNPDYRMYITADFIAEYITLALMPIVLMYLKSLYHKQFFTILSAFGFLPALIQGTGNMIIYLAIGLDNAPGYLEAMDNGNLSAYTDISYRLYVYWSVWLYKAILAVQFIYVMCYTYVRLRKAEFKTSNFFKFLANKEKLSLFEIQSVNIFVLIAVEFIRSALGRPYLMSHPTIALVSSILAGLTLFMLGYTGLNRQDVRYSIIDILTLRKLSFEPDLSKLDEHGQSGVNNKTTSRSEDSYDRLFEDFKKLMHDEQFYLTEGITTDMVADKLMTNRTYISRLLTNSFHCTFREFVNLERIEFACKLMLEHPDYTIEAVALDSGFPNAQSFSRKFKEIKNESPRQWIKTQKGEEGAIALSRRRLSQDR